MGGSTAIDPYQQYIDYLEDVVIYNLKRELSEALASQIHCLEQEKTGAANVRPTLCHKKDWSHLPSPPPPPPGFYMTSQHSSDSMLSGQFSYN
jgi:hypothetical protein